MLTSILLGGVIILLFCVVAWAFDLCLQAGLARLNIPEDVKRAVRAIIIAFLFIVLVCMLLSLFGVLPKGWL